MKTKFFWVLSFVVVVFAVGPGLTAVEGTIPADNSGVNRRDDRPQEMTAEQQGWGERDTELTRQIRREMMRASELSIYAQNVKVISRDGVVTLKGPVRSKAEVLRIARIAREIAGAENVRNRMDVVTQ